ncbi:MAG: hypothetical protein KJ749_13970 [Planctomycetes bacterium]|nr:hypothetical protein [Planctomycetota bacterium]
MAKRTAQLPLKPTAALHPNGHGWRIARFDDIGQKLEVADFDGSCSAHAMPTGATATL